MKELAVACRNSLVLILFLGMFGDQQRTMELYWVAAFCLLAYMFARASTERTSRRKRPTARAAVLADRCKVPGET